MHLRSDEKRRRIAAAAIPDDLLISEVLVHLPAKSLARCRCVCRSWRAGIAGAAFVRRHLHLSRSRPPSVLAIPREVDAEDNQATSTEISFHRLPLSSPAQAAPPPPCPVKAAELIFEKAWPEGITRIIHPTHCDGLVAIATVSDTVFLCNPATGEFVALPPGTHNAELEHCDILAPPVALGYDPWRDSYVVARYFYRIYHEWSQDYDIGHEIFTLAGGESGWELTQDPPHAIGVQSPICTRRAFYWRSAVPTSWLMRFDLQNRAFGVVPRPPTGSSPIDDMAELGGGKLCYVHAAAAASFQVWTADDGPELRWSLHCRVDLPNPVAGLTYSFMPVAADGDGILVAIVGDKVCRYNVQDGSVEEVVDMQHQLQYKRLDGLRDCMHYTVPYIESLVSVL